MMPMPAVVVLIVCRTTLLPADQQDVNAKWTGHENRDWKIEHGMMQCRRLEVQLFDQAEAMGAAAQPFNRQRCMAASIMLGVEWDQAHKGSSYRTWRVACPTPVIDTRTGDVISWVLPDCGHRDVVRCEMDTSI